MITTTVTYKYQATDKKGYTFHGSGCTGFSTDSEMTHDEIEKRIAKMLKARHPGCKIDHFIKKVTDIKTEKHSVLKPITDSFLDFLKDIIVIGIIGYVLVKIFS